MSKILALVIFGLLGASAAEAQEVYPMLPKQHFSCRYYTGITKQTVMIKDIDAMNVGAAHRLSRATELDEVPYSDPVRWVLLTDLNNPNPSEAFQQGVYVICTPTSAYSPPLIGKQSSGQSYVIASKTNFMCTYKSEDKSRLIYNKQIEAMNEFYAIRAARVNELIWDKDTPGRPPRWVLQSDMNNSRPTSSYTVGVNVSCLPLDTTPK